MEQKLLDRFFKMECTPEERREVIEWYLSGNADEALARKIEQQWQTISTDHDHHISWNKALTYEKILDQMDEDSKPQTPAIPISGKSSSYNIFKWGGMAASILLLISVGLWQLDLFQFPHTKNNLQEIQFISKQTARGEKSTITLSDGTTIKLNADSKLQYPENYSQSEIRKVYLEGEAFFDVTKDVDRPFVVHTGDLKTTVLGTSFNINSSSFSGETAVSVVTGKVKVEKNVDTTVQIPSEFVLSSQEQAVYSLKETKFIKQNYDYNSVVSWKDGTLYFENADFNEVTRRLEIWYGVEIVVRRDDIEDGFSGSYTNKSLETVLSGISFVLKFDYEIKDEQVIIK